MVISISKEAGQTTVKNCACMLCGSALAKCFQKLSMLGIPEFGETLLNTPVHSDFFGIFLTASSV